MARPIIALLTDFGLCDHYVAVMKGVALGICPEATLVDVSHDIPPQDVLAGALELAAAFRYFPTGTVFLAVVDPGVGSVRRGIAAEAEGYRFVGPDNGLLSCALDDAVEPRFVELTERRYARAQISRTFEGRDRFAPAAAWLAGGLEIEVLGRPLASIVRLETPAPRVDGQGVIDGEVVRVDRFGNLITNIDRGALAAAGPRPTVTLGDGERIPVVSTYADVALGHPCALVGSTGHLEIAVSGDSAARRLGHGRGARVRVRAAA